MEQNKTGKYLKYAIGEILLVMVGILLALQVNNWNIDRIENKEITNYYQRIHQEIEQSINDLKFYSLRIDTLRQKNERSLNILNLKNKDSLIELKETIGALGTAYKSNLIFPMIEEFIGKGYLSKVTNDSIKTTMVFFSIVLNRLKSMDDYIDNQYYTSIEPYFYKHINYAQVAMIKDRKELVKGGPETNYAQFYNDIELWNLLTFKLETTNNHFRLLSEIRSMIEKLDQQIVKELNSRSVHD